MTGLAWSPPLGADPDVTGLPPFAVQPPRSFARTLLEVPLLLFLAMLIAFGIRSQVAVAFYIPSGSMIPQLAINDRVVVSRISYRLHEPRRGDIVVFHPPDNAAVVGPSSGDPSNPVVRLFRNVGQAVGIVQPSTDEWIKRVIGLPGEVVEGHDGAVFVDGRRLEEPYLPPGTFTSDFAPLRVPPGTLWVMGDNRMNSSDSRVIGVIPRGDVVGRAILRVWPPGRTAFL